MTIYCALLRAVNVGGTGKLPMQDLRDICTGLGFARVKTYIASGNVVFSFDLEPPVVRAELEQALERYAGRRVPVIVRTRTQMVGVLERDPFPDHPGNQVMALFLNRDASPHDREEMRHLRDERIVLGVQDIFVLYPSGMGRSKLDIPAAREGTARNMNTVRKLVQMMAAF